ncbi:MAG: hypothetical protein ACUVTL_06940 [Thermoproteota archaeon]
MPRKKEKDIGSIIAAARKLREDMDAVASDMKEITRDLVLSILGKGSKRRGRPPKRGRPPVARRVRTPRRKRGRPPKVKKGKPQKVTEEKLA